MTGPRTGTCFHCGRRINAYTSYWGNKNTGAMFCDGWWPDDPHGGDACVEAAYNHALEQRGGSVELDKDGRNERESFAGGLFYYSDG